MKRTAQAYFVVGALLAALGSPGSAIGQQVIGTGLTGFEEVPVISTSGSGAFFARIGPGENAIEFVLVYENLEGGSVTQAHIHLGQVGVNGAIVVFLCSNLPNPPAGTQACPSPSGSVLGVVTAADVLAQPNQGIAAGDLAEVIRAIRAGKAYANVHTTTFQAGEIRGQLGHR